MIGQLIEKYSNLKLHCPRKTGYYYATNIPVDISFIPHYLFASVDRKWVLMVTLKESESTLKSVRLTQVMTLKFYGETVYESKPL